MFMFGVPLPLILAGYDVPSGKFVLATNYCAPVVGVPSLPASATLTEDETDAPTTPPRKS